METRMRPFHDVMASTVTSSRDIEPINNEAGDEDEDEVEDVTEFTPPFMIVRGATGSYRRVVYQGESSHSRWYSIVIKVVTLPYRIPYTLGKFLYKRWNAENVMITTWRRRYAVMTMEEKDRDSAKRAKRRGRKLEHKEDEETLRKENKVVQGSLKRLKTVSAKATRSRRLDQSQSQLLQLPIEVKSMIYDYLLPSAKAVHIVFHDNRLRSMICRHSQQNWGEGCYCRYMEGFHTLRGPGEVFKLTTGVRNLPLLLTVCRSIHMELSSYFFRTKTFKFHGPEILLFFGEINPSALGNMTSVYIDGRHHFAGLAADFSLPLMFLSKSLRTRYKDAQPLPPPINLAVYNLPSSRTKGAPIPSAWGAACIRLSESQSLTNLKVHLSKRMLVGLGRAIISPNTWCDDEVDKFVLEPLSDIHERLGKQLQRFEVALDWQGEGDVKDARKSKKRWGFNVKRMRVVGMSEPLDAWHAMDWCCHTDEEEGEQTPNPYST